MNARTMWKKLRETAGFTLVELIVVIVILGILAGVAIPVYNGYLTKTKLAADNELLAEVNRAFVSACMVHGVDNYTTTATATIGTDGEVTAVTVTGVDAAAFYATFDQFYENGKFEVYKTLKHNKTIGMFEGKDANGNAYANLTFDQGLLNRVKQSVFMTNPDLGVENLMDRVDFVSSMAAGVANPETNNAAWQMLSRYNTQMFADLGIVMPSEEEYANMTPEEQAAVMAPLYELRNAKIAMLNAQGGGGIEKWNEMTDAEKAIVADNAILSTYAVLDAAKGMSGKDPATVLSAIGTTSNFKDMLTNTDNEDGVAIASAAYGLYTAYAYALPEGDERTAAIAKLNDPIALMKGMDDVGFRTYLTTDQAKDDLDGYMAAMELIDNSSTNKEAVHSMMVNGFTDPALLAVIQQQMK